MICDVLRVGLVNGDRREARRRRCWNTVGVTYLVSTTLSLESGGRFYPS